MVANGALFGVVTGALLSLAGKLGAAVAGFALGRSGRGVVDRLIGEQERQRGVRLLARWGLLAILVSRPVPVLAETVVLLAGTSELRLAPVALITLVGSIPEAVAYGLAGAAAVSLGNQVLIWLALLVLAGLTWRPAPHRTVRHPARVIPCHLLRFSGAGVESAGSDPLVPGGLSALKDARGVLGRGQ